MKRLYEREREYNGRSKFWGYLWFCPDGHTAIIDHRESESPKPFELKEIVTGAA